LFHFAPLPDLLAALRVSDLGFASIGVLIGVVFLEGIRIAN